MATKHDILREKQIFGFFFSDFQSPRAIPACYERVVVYVKERIESKGAWPWLGGSMQRINEFVLQKLVPSSWGGNWLGNGLQGTIVRRPVPKNIETLSPGQNGTIWVVL
ncbi:hypothetical protein JTE90_025378 [Oedothorax gibbosus]|uniref:Uncharacterized protein n=1 Tax=Oedothorax gibbosus TaxID=931172 RepID=A0AAV6TPB0_9ARAC|nr:hypothetical protein JTE90_025378 [Oedothorax gibbosus]